MLSMFAYMQWLFTLCVITNCICLYVSLVLADYRCGSLQVRPCDLKLGRNSRPGFTCETTDEKSCLDRQAWCRIGHFYMKNEQCANSENLMFDKCLSIDKTIDGVKYHLNIAEVDWTVAEQYCQSKGMNLVSFQGQKEYDKVIDFLNSVREKPEEIFTRNDIEYQDKLSQRCFAMQGFINRYWTGLYFDRYENKWKYSDGRTVNKAITAGSVKLRDALSRYSSTTHTGYVGIVDKDFDFIIDEVFDGHRRIDALGNRAKILCKKNKNRKWNGGILQRNSGCITGFKCFGNAKCITGVGFENSDICNGHIDCDNGVDELTDYCKSFTAQFPDMRRIAHFTPLRRSVSAAKAICHRQNWTLPSIREEGDVQFLKHLPVMFAHSGKSPDFILNSENWLNLDFVIPLGIKRDSRVWSDGSAIKYWAHEISDLPSNSDLYIVFNASVSGKLVALYEPPPTVFPVCQEVLGYQVVPVPAVIPITVKHAPKLKNWSKLRIAVVAFALYLLQ